MLAACVSVEGRHLAGANGDTKMVLAWRDRAVVERRQRARRVVRAVEVEHDLIAHAFDRDIASHLIRLVTGRRVAEIRVEMSRLETRIRLYSPVRTASWRLPLASSRIEFFAALNSFCDSSAGRSWATAIIIPNTVETNASMEMPARIRPKRNRLSLGRDGLPLVPGGAGS